MAVYDADLSSPPPPLDGSAGPGCKTGGPTGWYPQQHMAAPGYNGYGQMPRYGYGAPGGPDRVALFRDPQYDGPIDGTLLMGSPER